MKHNSWFWCIWKRKKTQGTFQFLLKEKLGQTDTGTTEANDETIVIEIMLFWYREEKKAIGQKGEPEKTQEYMDTWYMTEVTMQISDELRTESK